MFPDVRAEPCPSIRKHSPSSSVNRSGDAPEVGVVVRHPTTTSIHHAGGLRTSLTQVLHHLEQRLSGLRKVAHLSRPVVHLRIDVDGVFGIPWGIALVVPHTLQVGWLSPWL